MYQVHYEYDDKDDFRVFLIKLGVRAGAQSRSALLFHIFIDSCNREHIGPLLEVLHEIMPDALYTVASTNGNIAAGELVRHASQNITVVCDVFESPDTKVEILQLPMNYETQNATVSTILEAVRKRPWVRAVEIQMTIFGVHTPAFCMQISALPQDVAIFGGVACGPVMADLYTASPFVGSSSGEITNAGAVFVLYGGEDFHAMTQATIGWKPLGLDLEVTSTDRSVIYELDGKPAYDVYNRYLKIKNDESFFSHSLLFPLAFDIAGLTVLKTPIMANPDRSLQMTSELSGEHMKCRIAYGDPGVILRDIDENVRKMNEFAPQCIRAYSCAGRKLYWGDDSVSRETIPFNAVAPTSGYYTGSEFMRHMGRVFLMNVTLVTCGLREGAPVQNQDFVPATDFSEFDRHMALVQTLTAFIGQTSQELDEAYRQMEFMAITDGLTGLYNRMEIERRIVQAVEDGQFLPSLAMIDIDDFKKVNDTYGHKAGDTVLRTLGKLFKEVAGSHGVPHSVGRWGGEEFMILLPRADIEEAAQISQEICKRFAEYEFEGLRPCTISIGVVRARVGEDADSLCMRADTALYSAKGAGKNRVVVERD